ncbi:pentapeptide repeat-containing protein [Pseudomonas sichuanensis]|uniref:Pentapeptide repeat-containing protein n=3 Tax=Pseudomonas TaxID=286 RepID=A0ABN5TBW9_9PSED|nr:MULTISPECIES: pentapeptide repeat-containing protein [Pseudomonas]AZL66963.1 pentapeptide repeat-containing protein [Pseudomonas oryziphila]AZL72270.1 pentapeptide repeat-containing protein [Pseudomonas oryziphila]MDH0732591.1 pentapeptide repeat-containing protein [Pseudomonas sichuanensis]MDH1583107.1 pentapeptide repeat-containing protein [Pseudomonas sichuanensis]MDH1595060.1 pentapeptide repeat-containing protein [Pseudomonas sichuanensis]
MNQPRQLDNVLYALVRDEKIATFNREKPTDAPIDFRGGDFRGLDLRNLDVRGIDFTDAYFRAADLRGLDLRETGLEGASIAHAQISGTYFPSELSADEILMSLKFGTRLRYRTAR